MSRRILLLIFALLLIPVGVVAAQTDDEPVVRGVMFWMDGCPHCHYVIDNVLPPLQAEYGAQLDITLVELKSAADADRLYVFLGKSGVFAFSHSGDQLWRADVGSKPHDPQM